LFKNSFL